LIYIVAGVSGVGKTTIGKSLAQELSIEFLDADDFHPEANISKMAAGRPLDDEDRQPWLEILNQKLVALESQGAVLACSALKESYRKTLSQDLKVFPQFVFLKGSFELIKRRMASRKHFMPSALLQSQYDDFELPLYGLHIDVENSPNKIIKEIIGSKK